MFYLYLNYLYLYLFFSKKKKSSNKADKFQQAQIENWDSKFKILLNKSESNLLINEPSTIPDTTSTPQTGNSASTSTSTPQIGNSASTPSSKNNFPQTQGAVLQRLNPIALNFKKIYWIYFRVFIYFRY